MPSFTTAADATTGVAYAALLASEERRQAGGQHVLVGDQLSLRRHDHPTLAALRAGQPVMVNMFRVPKAFRPDDINPSSPVTVYPDGRIEATS